jgi:phosphoribosyl 1,2-cyclic phosphate phosphodiesterase
MVDTLKFIILGCGASPGVPRVGGDWGACDPANPKNRRRRCSALIERWRPNGDVTRVLIDTSPDLRAQALDAGFGALDGVLYTHAHADHVHGIDDLRGFVLNMRRRVDIYADAPTLARLKEAFGYCFATPPGSDYPPILNAHQIAPGKPVTIEGDGGPITALPVTQAHGNIGSLGFRIGGIAYSPDVSGLSPEAVEAFAGLDVWVVDALRYRPHPSHFSLAEALDWIERVKPGRAVLTHMHVDLDYARLRTELPVHVEPGYDGWAVELPVKEFVP